MKQRNKNFIKHSTADTMYKQFSHVFLQLFFLLHFCECSLVSSREKLISPAPVRQIPASSELVHLHWSWCVNRVWQKKKPPLSLSEQRLNECCIRWETVVSLMELVYWETSTQMNFVSQLWMKLVCFGLPDRFECVKNVRVTKVVVFVFLVEHWFKSADFKQFLYGSLGQSWTQLALIELWCVKRFIWLVSSWKQSH